MANLFENMLSSEESIFLNPQFLDYDYQPKLVPFREAQQNEIALCIKPLLQRRNGRNIFIHGNPGVGKTVCLKHVLNELKENHSDEIFCIYVNCWKKDTSFKAATAICEQLKYKWIHNKTFDDLMKTIAETINEKSAVIVLDEADKLQDNNIIYTLLEDVFRISLILITNYHEYIAKLDNRIRSRLIAQTVEFKPYNREQTAEILRQRIKYSFVPDCVADDILYMIADKTFEAKDMRTGLFLLKQAGENAENSGSRNVKPEHLKTALESASVNSIEKEDDTLLNLIKENSGKSSSEIFKLYEEKEKKTLRTFQRKLKELEAANKIKLREENNGFNGRQTIIEYAEYP